MKTTILVLAVSSICAMAASRFMWWATKRSGLWAMVAGVLLALLALAGAVAIAWLVTRAAYGT